MTYVVLFVVYLAVSLFTAKLNYQYNQKRIVLNYSGKYQRAANVHGAIWTSFVPIVGQAYALYQIVDYNIYHDGFNINRKIFVENRSNMLTKRNEEYENLRKAKIALLERALDSARTDL